MLTLQSERFGLIVRLTVVHGKGVVALGDGGLVAGATPGEREVVHLGEGLGRRRLGDLVCVCVGRLGWVRVRRRAWVGSMGWWFGGARENRSRSPLSSLLLPPVFQYLWIESDELVVSR